MDNWNDLKLVLAIQRAGTLGGGASTLGVDHSTAFRRLNGLEARIGTRLFERLPGGVYQATPAGELFGSTAERVETETAALSRAVDGRDTRLTGSLRITASETLANSVLTPHLAAFHAAHPGIVVDLVVDSRVLSLSRREADIALRVVRPKEPDLFGRKLADIGWAIYGAPALLDPRHAARDIAALAVHGFVGCGTEIADISAAEWLAEHVAAERIVYRANSMINQLIAARAGIGLAVLPCFLGDPEPGLRRAIPAPIAQLQRELWIVTHADLRKTARVRAFLEIVGEGLAKQQALFSGA